MSLFNLNDLSPDEIATNLSKIDGITKKTASDIASAIREEGPLPDKDALIALLKDLNVQGKYLVGIREAVDVNPLGENSSLCSGYKYEPLEKLLDEDDAELAFAPQHFTVDVPTGSLNLTIPAMGGDLPVAFPITPSNNVEEIAQIIIASGNYLNELDVQLDKFEKGEKLKSEKMVALYNKGVDVTNNLYEYNEEFGLLPFNIVTGETYTADPFPNFCEMIALERAMGFQPVSLLAAFSKKKVEPEDVGKEILFKILGALGIVEVYGVILEILEKTSGRLLKRIGEALINRNKAELWKLIKRLLKILKSKRFFRVLVTKVGRKKAGKIVGKILAKYIPYLGWMMLIGNILAVIITQIIVYSRK